MKYIVKNSPNHYNGRAGYKADMIVFHQTGGDTLSPALNWYMNPSAQCSPNWIIDKNGDIYQLVSPDNAAWCNGTTTNQSDSKWYGYSLSSAVKSRKTNANYYTYSIEFVHCQWGNINDKQISAAVELIKQTIIPHMKKNGVTVQIDRAHLIGHSDVTPKTRDPEKFNCPGKKFPYDEIIERVNSDKELAQKPAQQPQKEIDTIAKEVIQGKWGAGEERKKQLTDAGYDYYEVQRRVNEMLRGL